MADLVEIIDVEAGDVERRINEFIKGKELVSITPVGYDVAGVHLSYRRTCVVFVHCRTKTD
jgi:hypothetical protein